MKTRRTDYLTDFVASQYPIDKFRELITITLDIVENFLATLEDGFNYDSNSICSYGEKYTSANSQPHSKIESLYINNIKNEKIMNDFLSVYYNAYNSLNNEEKIIFDATFLEKMTDLQIVSNYNMHSVQIRTIRKSAIVRFCLRCGLDKLVYILN